jgi:hypothetical protein
MIAVELIAPSRPGRPSDWLALVATVSTEQPIARLLDEA